MRFKHNFTNMKIRWYDWLIYRLFYWRWGKIMASRPDLREIFIIWLKAYDVTDANTPYEVTVTVTKRDDDGSDSVLPVR